jgi:hypothetical protein
MKSRRRAVRNTAGFFANSKKTTAKGFSEDFVFPDSDSLRRQATAKERSSPQPDTEEEPPISGIRIPPDLQRWIDARKRFHLSHAQVQMARELGLNPGKFGGLANHRQEPWKLPLSQYIEHLYFKRFGKEKPDIVRSIEERVKQIAAKKRMKQEAKRLRKLEESPSQGQADS